MGHRIGPSQLSLLRIARRGAALYSLMRTWAQHGVPPLPYLTDVLAKLPTACTASALDALLPHRWSRPETAPAAPPAIFVPNQSATH